MLAPGQGGGGRDPPRDRCPADKPKAQPKGKEREKTPRSSDKEGDQPDQTSRKRRPRKKKSRRRRSDDESDGLNSDDSIVRDMGGGPIPFRDEVIQAYSTPNFFGSDAETHLGAQDPVEGAPASTRGDTPEIFTPQARAFATQQPSRLPEASRPAPYSHAGSRFQRDRAPHAEPSEQFLRPPRHTETSSSTSSSRSAKRRRDPSPNQRRMNPYPPQGNAPPIGSHWQPSGVREPVSEPRVPEMSRVVASLRAENERLHAQLHVMTERARAEYDFGYRAGHLQGIQEGIEIMGQPQRDPRP